MKTFKIVVFMIILFVVLAIIAAGVVNYYHILFARKVTGEVISIQKVDAAVDVISTKPGDPLPPRMFSFAVAVEDQETREILVASSEDRRWATVEKGNCVTARFFPYPPWRLDKTGAYFGAQVITFKKACDKKDDQQPTSTPPPADQPATK
jgi:hypothetical protein